MVDSMLSCEILYQKKFDATYPLPPFVGPLVIRVLSIFNSSMLRDEHAGHTSSKSKSESFCNICRTFASASSFNASSRSDSRGKYPLTESTLSHGYFRVGNLLNSFSALSLKVSINLRESTASSANNCL